MRVFDVSDPRHPKLHYERVIGPQLNMVSQTWDGKRVYFTSSLLANWDGTGGEDAQYLHAFAWDGKTLESSWRLDFMELGLGRPHLMRFGQDDFWATRDREVGPSASVARNE